MTFVHPLLLGGLLLVGIPVLLHLIMRQKPKRLLFPAMRFLMQRHRTNQRKLQLRHLLLLLMRMLLIAFICLALARPKIFNERLNLTGERPRAVVLVFDTSPSMEYQIGGKSRLDDAKRRGQELMDDLPDGSKVVVLDSAEGDDHWLPVSTARERIAELKIRPDNHPVTRQIARAYEILGEFNRSQLRPEETPLPFLYVLSDRTQACWDPGQTETLQHLRDQVPAPEVHAVLVDVGTDKPEALALANLDLKHQVISAEGKVEIHMTVRATGRSYEPEIQCQIDDGEPERKSIKLESGHSKVQVFEFGNLSLGIHQARAEFRSNKIALGYDEVRFATFEVRGHRRVLIVADKPEDARAWQLALEASQEFSVETKSTEVARNLGPDALSRYQAVCLFSVSKPENDLWNKLRQYVHNGGGLAVIPGGSEMALDAYNSDPGAKALLPGTIAATPVTAKDPGVAWKEYRYQHPVLAPLLEWSRSPDIDFFKSPRRAYRYWEVEPLAGESSVLVAYADDKGRPALLERIFDGSKIRGRVLLFTTTMDVRNNPAWNNYRERLTSFYPVLANLTVRYLAGNAEQANFNFLCGQDVLVALPDSARAPLFNLTGPGIKGADAVVQREEGKSEARVSGKKAFLPGNYALFGPDNQKVACFSLNIPPEETLLTRVPVDQIEAVFGKDSVIPLDYDGTLRKILDTHWKQPVELLPWLMIAILLLLAIENLLANKFYGKGEQPEETPKQAEREEVSP